MVSFITGFSIIAHYLPCLQLKDLDYRIYEFNCVINPFLAPSLHYKKCLLPLPIFIGVEIIPLVHLSIQVKILACTSVMPPLNISPQSLESQSSNSVCSVSAQKQHRWGSKFYPHHEPQFCYLGANPKFQNPQTTHTGRKVTGSESKKRKQTQ